MNQTKGHNYLALILIIYILPSIAAAWLIINFLFCFFFQCRGYENLFLFVASIILGITICFWLSFTTVKIIDYLSLHPTKGEFTPLISKQKQILMYVVDFFTASIFYSILTRIYFLWRPNQVPLKVDEIYGSYYIIVIIYFVASVYFFGRTVGNLVTNSRILSLTRNKLTFGQIVNRTLTIFVPYNFVSLFGADIPYHDYFSKTIVVNNENTQAPKKNVYFIILIGFVALAVILKVTSVFNVLLKRNQYMNELKGKDEKGLYIEIIKNKVGLINKNSKCHAIEYYKSEEYNCLSTKSENCDLNSMSIKELKKLDNKLQEVIVKCFGNILR